MIKTITAYTGEIDFVEEAVNEIAQQLDLANSLMKNSVGIITCFAEFIDSGVVAAICELLPFDAIGMTCLAAATNGTAEQTVLTVSVLTSDDVNFAASVSRPFDSGFKPQITDVYAEAEAKLGEKPKLVVAILPLTMDFAGDDLVFELDRVSGGIPIFGTLTGDHTMDYHLSQTIYNGESDKRTMAIIAVSGNIEPEYRIAAMPLGAMTKQQLVITKSQGSVLMEVNGRPLSDFYESVGLTKSIEQGGYNALPFAIDFNDGTVPVARGIIATTPEGYAICAGLMPEGATLMMGRLEKEDVIKTSRSLAKELAAGSALEGKAALMFSCLGRNNVLGADLLAELEAVETELSAAMPFSLSYSGGEICPVGSADGTLKNRFHNESIIACIF